MQPKPRSGGRSVDAGAMCLLCTDTRARVSHDWECSCSCRARDSFLEHESRRAGDVLWAHLVAAVAATRQQLPARALTLELLLGTGPLRQLATTVATVAPDHRARRTIPGVTRFLAPGREGATSRSGNSDLQGSQVSEAHTHSQFFGCTSRASMAIY